MRQGFTILLLIITGACTAQKTIPVAKYSATIKAQADSMAHCLVSKNYQCFADYVYPELMALAGGRETMIATMAAPNESGINVTEVSIGQPAAIYISGSEWQCALLETLDIKTPEGRLTLESVVIAISNDKGKTWTFLDTSGKDLETIRQQFPNLSEKLVLPTTAPPKVIAE